ncbi:RNA polymerase sigma factor [Flavivirga sp. 57AJ16]|uniref:RNA polymerase sigma factor n=1 Tax=Flavivirga sp. 57AJ16 TaxID=3025307 RepID=UPI002366C1C1|nr:RNA polymerase sigma-70 factor [Flavivirga sp. 57AJ16]MDD7885099.1 RNA polymerase sigma-70 factor [Flavivirga sp. 57AJ16]
MKDLELLQKIKNDDRAAFDMLFKKYYKLLVRYIKSLSHNINVAEDVVQQVFMNLWINRHELNIDKTVKGYLYWVSYTSYIDQYRKIKRRQNLLDDIKAQALRDSIMEDTEMLDNRIKKLKKLIDSLPPVCKKVLELNKLDGLKYNEIAERLNISKKTVESHMSSAFKKIRKGFDNDKLIMFFIRNVFVYLKS